MGMKMGKVMSIMLTWSTNTPKKINISNMPTMMALVDKLAPVMTCTTPLLTPEKDRIWANVVAPMMMNKIMPEMVTVARKLSSMFFTVKAR